MIYEKNSRSWGDGQWHCPFSRQWVERMKKAVKYCSSLTEEQIKASNERTKHNFHYETHQEHYLEQPQDSRGLPLSSKSDNNDMRCCATYDYESIPDVVISNGYDDWPLTIWKKMYNS